MCNGLHVELRSFLQVLLTSSDTRQQFARPAVFIVCINYSVKPLETMLIINTVCMILDS